MSFTAIWSRKFLVNWVSKNVFFWTIFMFVSWSTSEFVTISTVAESGIESLKDAFLLCNSNRTSRKMVVLDVSLNAIAECPAQRKSFGELFQD